MIEQGEDKELTDYSKEALLTLTKPELSRRCKANGLPHTGNKPDLVERLREKMLGADPVPPGPVPPVPAPLSGTLAKKLPNMTLVRRAD